MSDFEELDYQETPLGELVLRRRSEPRLAGRQVFEVKLGDAFLMSSLFTAGEEALATHALATHGGVPVFELEMIGVGQIIVELRAGRHCARDRSAARRWPTVGLMASTNAMTVVQ